jgi:hypothetical protein
MIPSRLTIERCSPIGPEILIFSKSLEKDGLDITLLKPRTPMSTLALEMTSSRLAKL